MDDRAARNRARVQAERIKDAFDRAGRPVEVEWPGDGSAPASMVAGGRILTREEHAPQVREALGLPPADLTSDGDREGLPPLPVGLHVVQLRGRYGVGTALDVVDRRVGAGAATPDHVLHVSPVTWCMAIEPEPRPAAALQVLNTDPGTSGDGSLVVVVDTGLLDDVVTAHPVVLQGVTGDAEAPRETVGHYSGHGTFVASVVRAWAPSSEVRVEAVLSVGGAAFESDVVAGLERALANSPDVINLSAGTRTHRDRPLLSFEVFHERRAQQLAGTALVAAAGNDGDRGPFWPAAFPWVTAVGALGTDGTRAGFSDYGSWVDVYAPGTEVVGAFPSGPYEYQEPPRQGAVVTFDDGVAAWSGTSFAAPRVAGLVAGRVQQTGESGVDAAAAIVAQARTGGPGAPGGLSGLRYP